MQPFSFISALVHAWKTLTGHIGVAFGFSWPWLLLMVPANLWLGSHMVTAKSIVDLEPAPVLAALGLSLVGYSSIAVNWHRFVLRDETPSHFVSGLRLDRTIWRYLGWSLVISFVIALAMVPVSMALSLLQAIAGAVSTELLVAQSAILTVLIIVIGFRLSLKLTAVALENKSVGIGEALQLTRGQNFSFALLGLTSMCVLFGVGYVADAIIEQVFQPAGGELDWIGQLLREPFNWFAAIFAITLQTSLYGHFVEKRDY